MVNKVSINYSGQIQGLIDKGEFSNSEGFRRAIQVWPTFLLISAVHQESVEQDGGELSCTCDASPLVADDYLRQYHISTTMDHKVLCVAMLTANRASVHLKMNGSSTIVVQIKFYYTSERLPYKELTFSFDSLAGDLIDCNDDFKGDWSSLIKDRK